MYLQIETLFENEIPQPEEYGFPIIFGNVLCGLCLLRYNEPLTGVLKIALEGFSPGKLVSAFSLLILQVI